ncbi:MAG: hypothetical protein U0U67_06935 [Chitinophagales bacterium]
MKTVKALYLFISICIITLFWACQEKGMSNRIRYTYSFSIVDSNYNNLVGDTQHPNRYYQDSIKFYSKNGSVLRTNFPNNVQIGSSGYIYGVISQSNTIDEYIIKYNSNIIENDTLSIMYGNDNVLVKRNSQSILNKNNISQTTEIHFDIIK